MGSVKKWRNTNSLFSWFSGLKRNLSKCEVGGIGLLKEGKVTVCGIEYAVLTKDAIKILGTFFLRNKSFKLEQNFKKEKL